MKIKCIIFAAVVLATFIQTGSARRVYIPDTMTAGEKVETIAMLKDVIRDVQNMKCAVRLPFMRK